MMKKIFVLFLAVVSLAACLAGCQKEKLSDGIPLAGTWIPLQKGDRFRVVSSEIENGKISVVLELNCEQIAFSQYKKISIHECEYDVPEIVCDMSTVKELSGGERVVQPYIGFVSLEFTHNSIRESQDLENYCLEILDNDGQIVQTLLG